MAGPPAPLLQLDPERREQGLTLALLFASGFAGLVYQVLWMRELGFLFGNGAQAAATTLAAFFLGIASGGWAFGRAAERLARPLRGYGWLELGVAGTALLYFGLLDAFHASYAVLFDWLGPRPAAFLAVKFTLALGVLFPPAFFMGGTLPLMSQHLVRRHEALGSTASLLYAVNTLGAALGALAAAFALVPLLGVRGAYALAVATSVAVAGLAIRLGRVRRAPAAPAPVERASQPLLSPRALQALAFLSGAATLALEVLWTRMFAQVLQNSVYTFALVLVVFLVALALGAAAAGALARRPHAPLAVLVALLTGSGVWVALSPFVFVWQTNQLAFVAGESGFASYLAQVLGVVGGVLLLPTAWLGVVFPYCIKLAEAWGRGPGRTVGTLAALNTAGGVLGSLVAGFGLLEAFGLWQSLRALAAVYALAGLGLALRAGPRAAAALPAGLLLLLATLLDPSRLPSVWIDETHGERLIESFEGAAANVAVVESQDSLRRLKLDNHYGLGGTADRDQEAWQAHLPLLLHPAPRSAFLLGLGTGITAGAALRHPLDRLLVTELVPQVATAARRHFAPWINGLFEDPRALVLVEDGRNVLLGTRERFDVIVADLFLPWKAGVGSLYTRQHYQAALERLAPGGLYAQWLLLLQFSDREFGSVARSMVEVFPRVTLWRGNFRLSHPVVLLLGERDPRPLDFASLQGRLASLSSARSDLTPVAPRGVKLPQTAEQLLLFYQGNLSQARERLAGYPVNDDDRPYIEYQTPVTQREKRTGEASALRGRQLVAFYDDVFAAAPLDRDPTLAELTPNQRELPRAGLDLYRASLLQLLGETAAAESALARFEQELAEGMAPPAPR